MRREPRTDAALLYDMAAAAEAVARFIGTKTRGEYGADEVLRAAVERKIEILGEAARGLSAELCAANPQVPWAKITATRHVLAHDYDVVNDDIVWRIATVYVPELLAQLAPLLPAPPPDPAPEPA
jgi:uncharacterized protein with HEPN domain